MKKYRFPLKVISIFVTRTFEKSQTHKNAILWFFGGLLTTKTTF